MGRGPGTAQRAILDALAASVEPWLTIPDLAEATGRSPRQVRTAVHALEARGLVAITTGETGWRGRGDYGHWRHAGPSERDDPRTVTVQPGSRTPAGWTLRENFPAPVTFIRGGVPVSGLLVWLPERKVAAEDTKRTALAIAAAFRAAADQARASR